VTPQRAWRTVGPLSKCSILEEPCPGALMPPRKVIVLFGSEVERGEPLEDCTVFAIYFVFLKRLAFGDTNLNGNIHMPCFSVSAWILSSEIPVSIFLANRLSMEATCQ